MFMLIAYITCFAIYLAKQQCINLYFRWNISPFMTENNSSGYFWTTGMFFLNMGIMFWKYKIFMIFFSEFSKYEKFEIAVL